MDPRDLYSTVAPQGAPAPSSDDSNVWKTVAGPAAPAVVPSVEGGRTIGNYVMGRELGRGGMGVVYEATHRQFSDRRYALKLVSGTVTSPLVCERFQREVEAIGKSRHPHLLYAVDAGIHEGNPYLVTELVEGHDLGRILRECGPLPLSVACEIGRQMALGLEFAHAANIVHRDIKPQNVILQPNGEIKILDLGLASLLDARGDTRRSDHGIVGTPVYMPPEQWRGDEPSPASDIYSLGCTLFEMLAGRPPFPVAEYGSAARQRAAHADLAPPKLGDRAPSDVARLVDRCLLKSPDQRPRSCGDVASLLEQHAAPIDTTEVFATIAGPLATTAESGPHYDRFIEEMRFPPPSCRARSAFAAVFVGCTLASLGFLVMAYFSPATTEAWGMRFDRLAGRRVPPGTGFMVEATRTLLFMSCVFAVGYLRFHRPLELFFSIHLHTWRVWIARLLLVGVLAVFLGAECRRLWLPDNAATDMVAWARQHGIETTPGREVVPYRWYLGYSLIQYTFFLGGLAILPVLQFVLSDLRYARRSLRLFSLAQHDEPNPMRSIDRLYALARHFRRLATRYVDTAGALALGIQYEYWIGRWTLSENGYLVEVFGMLVIAGIMLGILGYIATLYAEAVEVTAVGRGKLVDHRVEQQVRQFNVAWLMKSVVLSRPSGIAILSLVLLLPASAGRPPS
jgi:hypothetical protein